jgi:tRNA-specific 2-thiouridylase
MSAIISNPTNLCEAQALTPGPVAAIEGAGASAAAFNEAPQPARVATPETTVVAMSGGVDSSTVAAILHDSGRPIVGLTMQLWIHRRLPQTQLSGAAPAQHRCCSIDDVYDARRVAETLGIPYYVVNHEERFERDVVRPFVEEYLAGRTPIPCSLCNNHLKFDQLLIVARQIGADQIATGHYAQVVFDEPCGRWLLKRPTDRSKDQTYFLFGLTQEQLSRTLFPLGGMTKPDVRELARKHSLAIAEKPDSQEICFVPGGDYKRFLEAYLSEQRSGSTGGDRDTLAGEMVTSDGKVIGEHAGVHNFTVGQRKGLGIATGSPLYVIQIKNDTRQVVVGKDEELYSRTLRTHRVNLISTDELREPMRVAVKIRHKHQPAAALIESAGPNEILVTFDEPQRALTPGQAAVFYDGDIVVGGGWIESSK